MAIIIPSRSIYQKDNPKVRDNLINKIEVNAVEITPNNEYEVPIYNENIDISKQTTGQAYNYDEGLGSTNYGVWSCSKSYVELKVGYIIDYNIEFSSLSNNKFISKIYDKLNKENESNIKYIINYNLKKYNVSVDNIEGTKGNNKATFTNYKETLEEDYNENGKMPEPSIQISSSLDVNPYTSSLAKIEETNLTNISILTVSFDNIDNKYSLNVTILCSLETLALTGLKTLQNTAAEAQIVPCKGERIIYTPSQVEITLYGDTIGIDLNDKTITIGEGNKPLSFEGNELMQTTNYLKQPINGESRAIEYLYGNTLKSFLKGKETATIRCSVVDYKDENDNVVISPNSNKPIFEQYDEVIPMAYGSNEPMFRYNDGNAKVFVVLANRLSRKGVLWQELTLQEKNITLAGLYNKVYDLIASWDTLGMNVESNYGYNDYINNASNPTNVLTKKSSGVKLVIANNITKIGQYAFQNCKTLTSIVIPKSIISIGGGAFNGCTSLISIELPNSIASISWDTFYDCTSLKNIKIPTSVTSIGANAFENCKSLTSIEIPNSVTSIGDRAFQYCSSLTSVVIPDSVTTMGSDVFFNCSKLTIYCEAESTPSGWNKNWNSSGCPVVWEYKS